MDGNPISQEDLLFLSKVKTELETKKKAIMNFHFTLKWKNLISQIISNMLWLHKFVTNDDKVIAEIPPEECF